MKRIIPHWLTDDEPMKDKITMVIESLPEKDYHEHLSVTDDNKRREIKQKIKRNITKGMLHGYLLKYNEVLKRGEAEEINDMLMVMRTTCFEIGKGVLITALTPYLGMPMLIVTGDLASPYPAEGSDLLSIIPEAFNDLSVGTHPHPTMTGHYLDVLRINHQPYNLTLDLADEAIDVSDHPPVDETVAVLYIKTAKPEEILSRTNKNLRT